MPSNMTTYNLEFHCLALQINGANLEVHTDSTEVTICEGIPRKTQQEARLSTRH